MRWKKVFLPPRDLDPVELNYVSDNLIENILIWLILLKLPSKGKVKKLSFMISSLFSIFKNVQKIRCYMWKKFWIAAGSWASHFKSSGPHFSHLPNLEDLDCKTCYVVFPRFYFFKVKYKLCYDFWQIALSRTMTSLKVPSSSLHTLKTIAILS